MTALRLGWFVLGVLATGCGSKAANDEVAATESDGGSPPADDDAPVGPTATSNVGVEATVPHALSACDEDLAEAELSASAKLAYDVDTSIHELIACGGLTIQVTVALVTGVVGLVFEDEAAIPGGLRYQGAGVYTSESSGGLSEMTMTVRLLEKVGEEFVLIESNLFDRSSYLVGVSVEAEADADIDIDIDNPLDTTASADADLRVTYESAGPWAKLLGMGDPPPNPLTVRALSEIEPDFSNIYLETSIEVHDVVDDSDVRFSVVTQPQAVTALFSSGGLTYDIVALEASNAELGQSLEMNAWAVAFGESNQLNGEVRFSVTAESSSAVGYDATLSYEDAAYGSLSFSCLD